MIYENILELIGNTPLVHLNKIEKKYNLNAHIYAKLEKNNPAGSVKDRAAYFMLREAIESNKIKKGATIIEPTSGNTGIGLACLCNYYGFKCIIIMPESASNERRKLLIDYNATLVLVNGGMKECVAKANEIKKYTPNSFIPSQFDNENNINAHYMTTAREINSSLKQVDYIVAGIGTGGTISGIGKYYKEKNLNTKIIGVEPEDSPLISKGIASSHKIQGIGANFIPLNFKKEYVDEIKLSSYDKAIECAKDMVKEEGLLVGISSGAALSVAINIAALKENEGKNIVVIMPDSGERYSWN